MLDNDASTAKTLTLVAIILQLIFTLIGIIEVLVLIAFLPVYSTTTPHPGIINYPAVPLGLGSIIIFIVVSIALSIGIIWVLLDYFLVYRRLRLGMVKEAKTPSLVLGIVQLIFGGFIPGILLIIAYVKIKDSLQKSASAPPPTPPI